MRLPIIINLFALVLLVLVLPLNSKRSKRTSVSQPVAREQRDGVVKLDDDDDEEEEEEEETGTVQTGPAVPGDPSNAYANAATLYGEKKVNHELAAAPFAPESTTPTIRSTGDLPRGPIVFEEQLEYRYATKFTPDAENKVAFIEPEILPNCWMQAMLSNKYHFAPQCNGDGSFASKQCYQERCWCVNRDGSPQVKTGPDRFHYEIRGMTLKCIQNGLPV